MEVSQDSILMLCYPQQNLDTPLEEEGANSSDRFPRFKFIARGLQFMLTKAETE